MASKLPQIPERLLAKLWQERAARRQFLRAANGRRFRVVYPGRPGTTAGPDFRDAVLEEEGVGLVRGDVEVHVRQKDWDAHGHGSDPRYNGVVLHLVADLDRESKPLTRLRSGQQAPVLSLMPLLEDQPSHGRAPDMWSVLGPHGYRPASNVEELGELLDRAGDARFLNTSQAFGVLLKMEDPDQVLYVALMEALGYSQNGEPFRELAYRVPYSTLSGLVAGSPPDEGRRAVEVVLLKTAGFLPASSPKGCMTRGSWHLFRVRPQNHPTRRIIGFSYVLYPFLRWLGQLSDRDDGTGWTGAGLTVGTLRLMLAPPEAGHRGRFAALERVLMGDVGRAGCGGKVTGAPIGRGRAGDMVVNCVLPLLYVLGGYRGQGELAERCLEMYRAYPRLQENELTREMARQLVLPLLEASRAHTAAGGKGYGRVVSNARRQQGLLHLQRLASSPVSSSTGA